MEEARTLLRNCHGDVDIIIARDVTSNTGAGAAPAPPVERRKRRRLPPIERPRSAPIYGKFIKGFKFKTQASVHLLKNE